MIEHLSQIVGSEGYVYAMDISEKQPEIVKEKLAEKNIANVTLVFR